MIQLFLILLQHQSPYYQQLRLGELYILMPLLEWKGLGEGRGRGGGGEGEGEGRGGEEQEEGGEGEGRKRGRGETGRERKRGRRRERERMSLFEVASKMFRHPLIGPNPVDVTWLV